MIRYYVYLFPTNNLIPTSQVFVNYFFCVVMFGLINVNILYYSFSTLYQMCNLRQSL